MIVLGISLGVNSGASIVKEGRLTAAVNEERFNRIKFYMGFPERSIKEVLKISQILPQDIDSVVIASTEYTFPVDINKYSMEKPGLSDIFLHLLGSFHLQKPLLGTAAGLSLYKVVFGFLQNLEIKRIKPKLTLIGIKAPIQKIDHHTCHAAGAAFTLPWKESLVITADQMGDGFSSKVFIKKGVKLESVLQVPVFHSFGALYGYTTLILGYKIGREGKLTGLAAYGDPQKTLPIFEKYARFCPKKGYILNTGRGFVSDYWSLKKDLSTFSPEDIAAGLQKCFEDNLSCFVRHYAKKTGLSKAALAGGIFANVKVNQKIREIPIIENTYVFPHMGDGGLSAGAALYQYYSSCPDAEGWNSSTARKTKRFQQSHINESKNPVAEMRDCNERMGLSSIYLGSSYSNNEIENQLKDFCHQVEFTFVKDPETVAAKILAEGKIAARFTEAIEYGPRALGNRSILYHAGDVSVNKWLNKKLNRTEFMPFAPVILEEDAPLYLEGWNQDHIDSRFMTMAYYTTPLCREKAPAVVHIDGTARPQVLREKDNPSFYKLLKEYKKLTQLGIILNTSFNMHEEPIVCSPHHAIKAFISARFDALIMENYLVTLKL